ncbi:methionyl-tRNA formyltransferase [Plantibacter sp. MMLR14_011]|uniref:methionyl-tRNA formyltransferase n=1 Tax=Plantibacter sp. MMLR14_011 TaxID=1898746 RepID=UPI0008DDD8F5|nr:methionyl-tRNA formyltransferase [Plantibacter sp. MMLR14_011]OII42375.1 methionyl-tRNA formyltransferase [Plantibacter sp. MMLR14_011]
MRLVFAGTPAVAVPTLDALVSAGHEIAAVVTRPDAPLGRKRVLTPSPVAAAAERLGLPVIRAARLDDDATARIVALRAELGVIVAYGGLVREPLLSAPAHGWINLHFSLLPAWRGAAPVQRSVMAGDAVTGASVFQLVPALDAGDVFATVETPITEGETSGELLDRLAELGAPLTAEVVAAIAAGTAVAAPQQGEVSLAPKLDGQDGRIVWDRPVADVWSQIRGVTPEPGAFTVLDEARVKVHRAVPVSTLPTDPPAPGTIVSVDGLVLVGTADTPLQLLEVQPAGRTAMPAADWWRGASTGTDRLVTA